MLCGCSAGVGGAGGGGLMETAEADTTRHDRRGRLETTGFIASSLVEEGGTRGKATPRPLPCKQTSHENLKETTPISQTPSARLHP